MKISKFFLAKRIYGKIEKKIHLVENLINFANICWHLPWRGVHISDQCVYFSVKAPLPDLALWSHTTQSHHTGEANKVKISWNSPAPSPVIFSLGDKNETWEQKCCPTKLKSLFSFCWPQLRSVPVQSLEDFWRTWTSFKRRETWAEIWTASTQAGSTHPSYIRTIWRYL